MKHYGRISVCGAISMYNDTSPTLAPCIEPSLIFKQLRMEGFLVQRWLDRHQEGTNQMAQWVKEVRSIHPSTFQLFFLTIFVSFPKGENQSERNLHGRI